MYIINILRLILMTELKNLSEPWLAWLSGWAPACKLKGSPGSIPSQGTCLGCGPGREARTHWCFSPSLSFSLPLSLKINKWNLLKNLSEKLQTDYVKTLGTTKPMYTDYSFLVCIYNTIGKNKTFSLSAGKLCSIKVYNMHLSESKHWIVV